MYVVLHHLLRCVFTHETGCSEILTAQPTTPPPPKHTHRARAPSLCLSNTHTPNPNPPLFIRFVPLRTTGTGNINADATGAQLVALQRMLERLMSGEISRVELNWTQQVLFGYSDAVKAATWMAALPHMFVW